LSSHGLCASQQREHLGHTSIMTTERYRRARTEAADAAALLLGESSGTIPLAAAALPPGVPRMGRPPKKSHRAPSPWRRHIRPTPSGSRTGVVHTIARVPASPGAPPTPTRFGNRTSAPDHAPPPEPDDPAPMTVSEAVRLCGAESDRADPGGGGSYQ